MARTQLASHTPASNTFLLPDSMVEESSESNQIQHAFISRDPESAPNRKAVFDSRNLKDVITKGSTVYVVANLSGSWKGPMPTAAQTVTLDKISSLHHEYPIVFMDVSALTTSNTARRDHQKALGSPGQPRGGQGHQKKLKLAQSFISFLRGSIFKKSDPN